MILMEQAKASSASLAAYVSEGSRGPQNMLPNAAIANLVEEQLTLDLVPRPPQLHAGDNQQQQQQATKRTKLEGIIRADQLAKNADNETLYGA